MGHCVNCAGECFQTKCDHCKTELSAVWDHAGWGHLCYQCYETKFSGHPHSFARNLEMPAMKMGDRAKRQFDAEGYSVVFNEIPKHGSIRFDKLIDKVRCSIEAEPDKGQIALDLIRMLELGYITVR